MCRRTCLLVALLLLANPRVSSAIQLHWSSGADTLTFSEATRSVLVVGADSAETALPGEWRLLWAADSSGVQFVAPESLAACQSDTAKISGIDPPATAADSAAHQITAHFCSGESESATSAYFVVDLVGGSRGKFKVVALDPADPDSSTVIESGEVTYNGGVVDDYAPVLLRASSVHETAELRVEAIGAGLGPVQSITVGAPDGLWKVQLGIIGQTSTSITATAEVPAPLPQAVVRAVTGTASSGPASLPADQMSDAEATSAGTDTILYRDPNPLVYPKDFAFYYNSVPNPTNPAHPWKGVFHLLYIRNKAGLDSIIAHAWTDSLGKAWSVDTMAFRPSGVGWDKMRVWAPSIQQVGNLTYMFYTGMDSLGNQSIGYATTQMLGTTNISWVRSINAAYKAGDASWAYTGDALQFRDPFVMPDPDGANYPGRYLLFNAGVDAALPAHYTIGVARNNAGTLGSWGNLGRYEATDYTHLAVSGALESPLVVRDSLTGAWRLFVANADYDANGYFSTIFLTQSVGDSLTDIRATEWPQCDSLYLYVGNDADMIGWQACEHLQIGKTHFFAAYDGNGIGITRMHWDATAQKFVFVHPDVADVPPGSERRDVRFFLTELRPTAGAARFTVESVGTIVPRLIVYDVAGRRIRTLSDGRPVLGRAEFGWDCRDDAGKPISTGLYFARMTGAGPALVVRVPIVR